jgi:pyrimidine 5'-nucleotidase
MMTKNDRFHSVLIDLDETLYPKSNGVWSAISSRINDFIVGCLNVSHEDAIEIRQSYLTQYGTTLMGLQADHDINPHEYLEFVHNIPIERLLIPDTKLCRMLEKISARKIIFTNASIDHAHRIMRHLKIEKLIDQVIDIIALDFINKPHPDAYQRALDLAKISQPEFCVMVDDRIENLLPAQDLGMTTVLVGKNEPESRIDHTLRSVTDLLDVIQELAN